MGDRPGGRHSSALKGCSLTGVPLLAIFSFVGLASAAELTPEIKFEKYSLANGLEVILSEDHRLPLVATDIWYHVGAANEVPGRSGFAHLFEHIMFQGSRNVPEDQFFPYLEAAGATFTNGTTDFDRTNYLETVPSNRLELSLWLESDRMGFLLDTLTQERLDNQRAVVRKERQQSTENVPYGVAEEQFYKKLFPAPHPYNGVVIGSHADLEAATLEDVKTFFRTYYIPNNATLAVVGDFDPGTIKSTIEKYFGSLPASAEPPALNVETKPVVGETREKLTDDVELPKVYIGWITSPAFKAGDAELQLAASILADGKSSRLYEELVHKQQVAQSVNAYQYPLTLGSIFVVEILGKAGTDPTALEASASKVMADFSAKGPTQAEVTQALRSWQATHLRGIEEIGGFAGKADQLNFYNHHTGDAAFLSRDFARFAAVTPEALHTAFSAQIRPDNCVIVEVRPADHTPAEGKDGGVK